MGKGVNMILRYIVLSIGLDILLLWARAVLSRFLQTYDSIADAAILDEFKRIARWNMYGALAFLVCGGAGILWGVLLTRQQGLLGTFIVLALVMLAGVGAWKYADKRESEAKAQELRGR